MKGRLRRYARVLAVAGALGLLVAAFFAVLRSSRAAVASPQPIAFDHHKHAVDNKIMCATCHQGVTTQTYAGIPQTDVCMTCHQIVVRMKPSKLAKKPELAKLKEFVLAKLKRKPVVVSGEIPWLQLYTQPDYVFFSHRRHVVLANVECATCHGDIKHLTSPPTTVLVKQSMDWCVSCHKEQHASLDCISCHK